MLSELRAAHKVIGVKQSKKAIRIEECGRLQVPGRPSNK